MSTGGGPGPDRPVFHSPVPDSPVFDGPASIVITNRDYARFVGDAVDSALAQEDVEVVVVDDGSVDHSLSVLAVYGGAIHVVHAGGTGQAAAMNLGYATSTGDPVIFLDADDVLAPGTVARAREAFASGADVVRVQYPLRRIDAGGWSTGGLVPPDPSAMPAGDLRAEVVAHVHDLRWQPTSGNAFRRWVLEATLPIPEADYPTSSDHYLNAVTALHGTVVNSEIIGGDYRIHGSNQDARVSFDLDRVRKLVGFSVVTGRAVVAEATSVGLRARRPPRGVSFAANRLLLLRLSPDQHPIADDTRWRAVRMGVMAALGRHDLPIRRRIGSIGLLAVLAMGPESWLEPLAVRYLAGATDQLSTSDRGSR